jgi:hypothetical protein
MNGGTPPLPPFSAKDQEVVEERVRSLGSLGERLPTKRAMLLLFATCSFPIHFWSIFNLLRHMPAWIRHVGIGDIIGAAAYAQVFALLETTVLSLFLIFASVILPARFFRDNFAALGSGIVLLTSAWAIVVHKDWHRISWGESELPLWPLYAVLLGAMVALVFRYDKIADVLTGIAERLSVMLLFNLPLDAIGILIVIVRNL